jgi:secondary thiamine-phosphate synthase enzyme
VIERKIERDTLQIETQGRGLWDITQKVAGIVARCTAQHGLCNVFVRHTSASLIVSENADPAVCRDLERYFGRLVQDGDRLFEHVAEGPDDMPAHVRSVLTGVSLTIPIQEGRLLLGTWQGIYLWEHRRDAHRRTVVVTAYG